MKIAILVGHGESRSGGYDPGAVNQGYEEFKIAKEIAKKAYETLKYAACEVELINYDGTLNLNERINLFKNDNETDLIVEIHLNAGAGTGSEVYYYSGNKECKAYAEKLSNAISKEFNIRDRGAKIGDKFGIIRETKPKALLIECCFIDSKDLYLVDTTVEQHNMGTLIGAAIMSMLQIKLKTVPPKVTTSQKNILYRIQCGAFKNKINAQSVSNNLNKYQIDNYILFDHGLYKVIAGTYRAKSNAQKAVKSLTQKGFDCVITETQIKG